MGAVDLIANGKEVAIIDYHTGDTYANSYSNARLSYYGLTGTPTAWFDGGNAVVGGNHTTSMYSYYLPKYNARINTLSSFTIETNGTNSGMTDYEIEVTLEKVASSSATNIVMHAVLTESGIDVNWQGYSGLEHVERLMIPNQNGTSVDFSGGDIVVKTINFSMSDFWVNENCELVIFLQNTQNKEVLQAVVRDLSDFPTSNTNDASVKSVQAPSTVCKNNFVPVVEVANFGLENLTSLDITYFVNNEPAYNYNWTGDLSFLESEMVELPGVIFTALASNTFTVEANNPNGQPDQYPANNTVVSNMIVAESVTSPVSLALKLDDNPEEVSWEVVDSQNNVLYSGGSYTQQGQYLIESFELNNSDCYSFNIYDEGGDGLTGLGFYKLVFGSSNTVFADGTTFGFSDMVQFNIGLTDIDKNYFNESFTVYPNPVDAAAVVYFTLNESETVQLNIFNTVGERVYQSALEIKNAGENSIVFENNNYDAGLYFIRLDLGEKQFTKKLIFK
ncbi:MAG: T9SS type A sorting domain-containing protein [Bacteroidales bacterium]|nr:T9SS type A sorting domain-containing protein [Bacteroidales bacterium]MCF8403644.1 T9SS type A sorting domain-containing protein [Bacteroidales bacterium]